ncbi:MAG: DAK2 domain-containing protein [Eubacterium sp.]|nr:DAK2 domain-containing protein [Eubacterium sp.]
MSYMKLNAKDIAQMFLAGAVNLEAEKELINELNVFPVPDGDTGSNMTMTIMAAVDAVNALEQVTMKELSKAISGGSLRGARGNSGVILSQLCRGFTKVIREHDTVDSRVIAEAAEKAVETAYKAVMKPKEGTILTVARGVSERASELAEEKDMTVEVMMRQALDYGEEVLDRTPEMLPVLKEAGVVDSGGKGLLTILEGAYAQLTGTFDASRLEAHTPSPGQGKTAVLEADEKEIRFGYCTEFIINRDEPMPDEETVSFKKFLMDLGDSLVLVADEDLVKVHVHTNDPGVAITKALTYGSLTSLKIDNMRYEHREKVIRDAGRLAKEQLEAEQAKAMKENGFIAVCAGEGFRSIFQELNVDYVISGGQTMNPSTDDFLNAIGQVHASNIFVFPNNSNIILAANQARDLTEDKNIIVIPTKTVPQAITAMINFAPDASPEENTETMCEMIKTVQTAQITYSIRDTSVDQVEIHKDDIMAVGDSGILCAGKGIQEVAKEAVASMVTEDTELISVYYGADLSGEDAEALADQLSETYPDCDVEVNEGGQPVYYCIISVE